MAAEQQFGIELKKAAKYHYRTDVFIKGRPYAVDRTKRDYLIRTGYFRDVAMASDGSEGPIPVQTRGTKIRRKTRSDKGQARNASETNTESEEVSDGQDAESEASAVPV